MKSCDIIILNYIKLINSNNLFVNCKYNGELLFCAAYTRTEHAQKVTVSAMAQKIKKGKLLQWASHGRLVYKGSKNCLHDIVYVKLT